MDERIKKHLKEDGDCLLWTGILHGGRLPTWKFDERRMTVMEALKGKAPDGMVWWSACRNVRCVAHVKAVKHGEWLVGTKRTTAFKLKVALAKRKEVPRTLEQVREVLAMGLTQREGAKLLGVNQARMHKIRNGQAWQDYASPWAGLG